jgi:hypothetical protein
MSHSNHGQNNPYKKFVHPPKSKHNSTKDYYAYDRTIHRLDPLPSAPHNPSKSTSRNQTPTYNTKGYATHIVKENDEMIVERCEWTRQDIETYCHNSGYGVTDSSKCPHCRGIISQHDDGTTSLTQSRERFSDDYRSSEYDSYDYGGEDDEQEYDDENFIRSEAEEGVSRRKKRHEKKQHSHKSHEKSSNKKNSKKRKTVISNENLDSDTFKVAEAEKTSVREQRKIAAAIADNVRRSKESKGQILDNPRIKRSRINSGPLLDEESKSSAIIEEVDEGKYDSDKEKDQTHVISSSHPSSTQSSKITDEFDEIWSDDEAENKMRTELTYSPQQEAANEIVGIENKSSGVSSSSSSSVLGAPTQYNFKKDVKRYLSKPELKTPKGEYSVHFLKRREFEKDLFLQRRGGVSIADLSVSPQLQTKIESFKAVMKDVVLKDDSPEDLKIRFQEMAKECVMTYERFCFEKGDAELEQDKELACPICNSFARMHKHQILICGLSKIEVEAQKDFEKSFGRCRICYMKADIHASIEPDPPANFDANTLDAELEAYDAMRKARKQKEERDKELRDKTKSSSQSSSFSMSSIFQQNTGNPSHTHHTNAIQQPRHEVPNWNELNTNHVEAFTKRLGSEVRISQKAKQTGQLQPVTQLLTHSSHASRVDGSDKHHRSARSSQRQGNVVDKLTENDESASAASHGSERGPSEEKNDDDGNSSDSSSSSDEDRDDRNDKREKSKKRDSSPPGPPDDDDNNNEKNDEGKHQRKPIVCNKFFEEFEKLYRVGDDFECNRCGFLVSEHKNKPTCAYIQDDFVGVKDKTQQCSSCKAPIYIHDVKGIKTSSPPKIQFDLYPKFKMSEKQDPFAFISGFEDALRLNQQPSETWLPILKHCVEDENLKQWIHSELLVPQVGWMGPKGAKALFIKRTIDPEYETRLQGELARLKNKDLSDLRKFFEQFKDKCYRLNYDLTSTKMIDDCEYKLCNDVKETIRLFRLSKLSDIGHVDFRFNSIQELQKVAELALRIPNSKSRSNYSSDNKNKSKNQKDKYDKNSGYKTTHVQQENSQSHKKKKKKKYASNNEIKVENGQKDANLNRISNDPNFDMKKNNNTDFSKPKANNQSNNASHTDMKCFYCNKKGHIKINCSKFKKKQAEKAANNSKEKDTKNKDAKFNYINAFGFKAIKFNAIKGRKIIAVKLKNNNALFIPLPDSGAELSLINRNLAQRLKLHIFEPTGPQNYIKLGDQRVVKRIGFVQLPITVMFPETLRKPIVLKQQFEVFNIENDFVFGTDILPTLFPDDEFTSYMVPHSSITEKPTIELQGMEIECVDENEKNNVEHDQDDMCVTDETFWSRLSKSTTPTYSWAGEGTPSKSSENTEKSNQIKSYKQKIDIDILKAYDHVVTDVEKAINDEFQEMYQQMLKADNVSNRKISEEQKKELSDVVEKHALDGVMEYLDRHHIEWKGPFRSTFEKRLLRHQQ